MMPHAVTVYQHLLLQCRTLKDLSLAVALVSRCMCKSSHHCLQTLIAPFSPFWGRNRQFRPTIVLPYCRYAKLERGLGEVDRARAIYVHASAMADPRRDKGFWADWNAFEVVLFFLGKLCAFLGMVCCRPST